jgi:hypothetical protein
MSRSAGKKAGGGGGSLVWLQGLACGALATLAPATALLGAVLLAPGLAALILDRESGRSVARGMLLFGVAASVEPVRSLWRGGQGVDTAFAILGDWKVIGLAWIAAAMAWLLAELLPVVAGLVLDAGNAARAARLRAARDRIIAEWGTGEPDGTPPPVQ